MINTTVFAGRRALAALVLASSVAVLAGCSAGVVAPQDMSGVAGPGPGASARAVSTVGDDPNGCYQFGQGTNQAQGWQCSSYTGSAATITVPSNATGIQVSLAGGQGGEANPAAGGYGTVVTGTWSVTGGQTLGLTVGQGADDQNPGGGAAGGGKAGGSDGGGGGGASAVEIDGRVIAVAGGGGGGRRAGRLPRHRRRWCRWHLDRERRQRARRIRAGLG